MYELDRKKFGAFISELRKEKGYTQKDLAQKLLISDKAISKWETGVSFPDTALLIPLAEVFGVTVTELLLCERMEKEETMNGEQVENIVKTAIAYSEDRTVRAYQVKTKWPIIYLCSLAVGIMGTLYNVAHAFPCETLITAVILGAVFGGYFCFFVKTKLPAYYDENKCGLYYDGPFRMNIPGVSFRNSNWPHIVRGVRVWSCLFVSAYPILNIAMSYLSPMLWQYIQLYVCLLLLFGGLFIPVYVLGKKFE